MEAGIKIGKHLTRIREAKPYGFLVWCMQTLYLSDLSVKIFMLMYENPDAALESSTQSDFMRRVDPHNPRFILTRQFKPKLPKYDSWDVTGLALFYWDNYRDFPQELKTSFGLIPDVQRFYESYLQVIKNNNGNMKFKSYLDRLTEVKQILMKKKG